MALVTLRHTGVSIAPGQIVLTVKPIGAASKAAHRDKPRIAALEAE